MSPDQASRSYQAGDICGREIPKLLTKAELKRLSQIDSRRFTFAVLIEVATFAAAVVATEFSGRNPFVYALAVIVLGSRINAFGALMHDAAHHRAYQNRVVNEIVGELLAFPTSSSMAGYRNTHFAHHRALNGDDDPDWARNVGREEFVFPTPRSGLTGRALRYLFGLKVVSAVTGFHGNKATRDIPALVTRLRLAGLVALLAASIVFGFWQGLILYWLIPLLTVFLAIRYLRNVAEHYAVEHVNVLNESRTVLAPFWERWLIAPWGLNYHLEHHLYPSIPSFRLREAHELLMTRDPFPKLAHVTQGYFSGLFRDCAVNADPAPAAGIERAPALQLQEQAG